MIIIIIIIIIVMISRLTMSTQGDHTLDLRYILTIRKKTRTTKCTKYILYTNLSAADLTFKRESVVRNY
jgi:hypothetical protein